MAVVMVYLVVGLLCAIFVHQFATTARLFWSWTPRWFAPVLFGFVMLLLVLVPQQSEVLTEVFRAAQP